MIRSATGGEYEQFPKNEEYANFVINYYDIWNNMDRFLQLEVFAAVAEEEGFNAAARRLKMSPPAVTRTIAALEERLGVKLFNRTTRFVRVTDAGAGYLQDARRILADLESADEAATGINATPRGQLVVTAPLMFGNLFVMPVTLDYLQQFPGVSVETLFVDRMVNLIEEGIDVGIRIGELADSSIRALKVGEVRQVLVASPRYLEQQGEPITPEDLNMHQLVSSTAGNFSQDWHFKVGNKDKAIRVKSRLSVATNDAAIKAAEHGFGISRVLSYQVASQLQQKKLRIVLSDYELDSKPINIVHHEGRFASVKVRSYIDFVAERLMLTDSLK